MREERDEGVQGLRKVKIDRSNLRKMKGRLWVGAERGFSLIELIGVLAVMGILASMTVPPIIRQIRQAQTANEEANLNEVARAIVEGIKATGTIPNPNTNALFSGGWATISLPYTALGTNQLLYVTGTNADQQRRMFLSGGLTNYFSANTINPPFTTPSSGWPTNFFPSDLQLVLVSSSREDMVLSCSNSVNLASNDVVWLKNYVKTPDASSRLYIANNTNVVPSSWSNRGEFLHVKTVDLRPLFCRVDLEDLRSPATATISNAGSNYPVVSSTNTNGITMQLYASTISPSNLTSVAIVSGAGKNLWSVSGNTNIAFTNNLTISGGSNGLVSLAFPSAPQFGVGTNQAIMSAQDLSFYLIKGTSLNLSGAGVIINQDSKFQYSNGAWRQLY